MECILVRHGIAVEAREWDGDDAARPLTEKGKTRTLRAAAGLRSLGLEPTHILSSPYARARETAALLQSVLPAGRSVQMCRELEPDRPPSSMVSLFASLPPAATVVCVGHEPTLGQLASVLLTGKPLPAFRFKKAGACLIELPDPVQPARGILRWWLEPLQLRMLGDCDGGDDERD